MFIYFLHIINLQKKECVLGILFVFHKINNLVIKRQTLKPQ